MPSLAVAHVKHSRTSSPQEVEIALKHGSRTHKTPETDDEEDIASYSPFSSKNIMIFTAPKNEEEDLKKKSAAPGCVTRPDPVPGSQAIEHGESTFQRPEISTFNDFWKRTQNDRNAVESHIKKEVSKDGTASGKAKLVAKQDRFGQLRLWCNDKLEKLEVRKGRKSGSARTLFPQYYSEAEEDAWLRKTFAAWLDADEEDKSNKAVPARGNTKYPTPFTQFGSQHDDEDQDDEEIIPIKRELQDDDGDRTGFASSNIRFGTVPQRNAAMKASANRNMRDPSTPDSDKAYFAQQRANHAIKMKREATTSSFGNNEKREEEYESASDEEYAYKPPKKYVAVGLNGHFNGAKVTPQKLECTLPDGKVIKVVRRAWVWNENDRMVVFPPF